MRFIEYCLSVIQVLRNKWNWSSRIFSNSFI